MNLLLLSTVYLQWYNPEQYPAFQCVGIANYLGLRLVQKLLYLRSRGSCISYFCHIRNYSSAPTSKPVYGHLHYYTENRSQLKKLSLVERDTRLNLDVVLSHRPFQACSLVEQLLAILITWAIWAISCYNRQHCQEYTHIFWFCYRVG